MSKAYNEHEVVLPSHPDIMHPVLAFVSQYSGACSLGRDLLLPSLHFGLTPSSSGLFLFLQCRPSVTAEVPIIPVHQARLTSAMIHDLAPCNFRRPSLFAALCRTMIALAVILRERFLLSGQIRRLVYTGTRHKMGSNWMWKESQSRVI